MSQITLSANASGSAIFTVAAPGTSTNQTLTLPDATATLVGDSATQTLTNKTLTAPIITGNLGAGGASYGTAGQVLTSAGTGASPAWSSVGFGGTVVSNKTGSRAASTTYQNTTGGWLLVCFSMTNNGVTFLVGSTSGLGITAMSSNFSGNVQTYLVPTGWYYQATGSVLSNWTEGQA